MFRQQGVLQRFDGQHAVEFTVGGGNRQQAAEARFNLVGQSR
ncbi:MAG TPA: hypothetical protein VGX76_12230 [Pirellulales bacterium]|nr:hypothetical protein [Pirellulales bacterium]